MSKKVLDEVRGLADSLNDAEVRELIRELAKRLTRANEGHGIHRLLELAGSAQAPMVGKEAQAWVSENRDDADEARKTG